MCVKARKFVTKLIAAGLQAGAETDSTSPLICYPGWNRKIIIKKYIDGLVRFFGDTEADAGCRLEVGINRGKKHQRVVFGNSGSKTLQDVGASAHLVLV